MYLKSVRFYISGACKWYPFRAEPPRIGAHPFPGTSSLFARAQVILDEIFRLVKTAKQFLSVFSAILRIG